MSDGNLIDDILFEKLIKIPESNDDTTHVKKFNYCSECNAVMDLTINGYECSKCGLQKQIDGNLRDCDEESVGTLRVCKAGQSGFYNITPDYAKTQKKAIIDQLLRLSIVNKGIEIPKEILMTVATTYNDIQKAIDEDNEVAKRFVRRGSVKDEILGALIKYECIKNNIPKKTKTICEFMKLATNGITRGETILRNLYLDGKIELPTIPLINKNAYRRYTEQYLTALKINKINYQKFINDLVEMSIKKKIGMNSIITSKIAGSIWVLINHEKLKITVPELEQGTENIRKNTWIRYAQAIEKNILKFIDVFNKNGIDHGVIGSLIKKKEFKKLLDDNIIDCYSIKEL